MRSLDDSVVVGVYDKDFWRSESIGEVRLGTVRRLMRAHGDALAEGVSLRRPCKPAQSEPYRVDYDSGR